MDPTVLAWALALPVTSRYRSLAEAYTSGATRVMIEGRSVEYRSTAEIAAILTAGYRAEHPTGRRPGATYAQVGRAGW